MRRPVILSIILFLVLALAYPPVTATATPEIRAYPPPSMKFPLKVYVYPDDFDYQSDSHFTCQYHDLIVGEFQEVLRNFRLVTLRFAYENPSYEKIINIRFVNASSPSRADITFRIVKGVETSRTITGSNPPYEMEILCEEGENGENLLFATIFHELLHSLGVGHATVDYAGDGKPELMRYLGEGDFKVYPSTLDLYAVYRVFFTEINYGSEGAVTLTLPQDLDYHMVTPYSVELETLKNENLKLRKELQGDEILLASYEQQNRELQEAVEDLKEENQDLRSELEELRANYSSKVSLLESYADAYTELFKENLKCKRLLRDCFGNLSFTLDYCNKTIKSTVEEYNSLNKNYSLCLQLYNSSLNRSNKLSELIDECSFRLFLARIAIISLGAIALYSAIQWWRLSNAKKDKRIKVNSG